MRWPLITFFQCIYQFVVSRFVEFFGNSMDRTVMKTSNLYILFIAALGRT